MKGGDEAGTRLFFGGSEVAAGWDCYMGISQAMEDEARSCRVLSSRDVFFGLRVVVRGFAGFASPRPNSTPSLNLLSQINIVPGTILKFNYKSPLHYVIILHTSCL